MLIQNRFPMWEADDLGASGSDNSGNPPVENLEQSSQAQVTPPIAEVPEATTGKKGKPDDVAAMKRAMNESQRELAELKKVIGDISLDELPNAVSAYSYLSNDPEAALLELARTIGPDKVMQSLAKEVGWSKAAQIMNESFGGQNVEQADPMAEIPDEYRTVLDYQKQQIMAEVNKTLSPIQKMIQEREAKEQKSYVDAEVNTLIKDNPELGVDQAKFWAKVAELKVPLNVLVNQPWLIESLLVKTAGGLGNIKSSVSAQAATKRTNQVVDNYDNTARLTPAGGGAATQIPEPITNEIERRKRAMDMIDRIASAQQ